MGGGSKAGAVAANLDQKPCASAIPDPPLRPLLALRPSLQKLPDLINHFMNRLILPSFI